MKVVTRLSRKSQVQSNSGSHISQFYTLILHCPKFYGLMASSNKELSNQIFQAVKGKKDMDKIFLIYNSK